MNELVVSTKTMRMATECSNLNGLPFHPVLLSKLSYYKRGIIKSNNN